MKWVCTTRTTFSALLVIVVVALAVTACSRSAEHYYDELKSATTYGEYEDILFKYKADPTPEKVRAALAFYKGHPEKWSEHVVLDLTVAGAKRYPDELREECVDFGNWLLRTKAFVDTGHQNNDGLLRMGVWWYLVRIGHHVPEKTLLKAVEFELERASEHEKERLEGTVLQLVLKAIAILGSRGYPSSTWWNDYLDSRDIPYPSVYLN